MRKIIFVLILLLPLISFADVDTKDGTAITTSTTLDGQSGIDTADGQTITSATATDYTADANCQGAWLFNDDLTDASGKGNTLSVNGTPPGYSTTRPSGFSTGKSYEFDGTNDEWLYKTTASANFPGPATKADFTIGIWYKRSATADSYQTLMGSNVTWAVKLGYNAASWDEFYTYLYDGDTSYDTLVVNNTTNWYHVVMSFDGSLSTMTVWISSESSFGDVINGETWCPSGCDNTGYTNITQVVDNGAHEEIFFGIKAYDDTEEYNGLIYQPIVFDRTVNGTESQEMYTTGITGAD